MESCDVPAFAASIKSLRQQVVDIGNPSDAASRRRQSGGVGESEAERLVEDEAFVVRRRGLKDVGAGRSAKRQRETTIDKSHG